MEAAERLLERGWGGLLTLDEALFIRRELRASPPLRRTWHIRGKSCPLSKIAERAFPENSQRARQNMINEMSKANRSQKPAVQENVESLASHKKAIGSGDRKVPGEQLVLL